MREHGVLDEWIIGLSVVDFPVIRKSDTPLPQPKGGEGKYAIAATLGYGNDFWNRGSDVCGVAEGVKKMLG